MSSPGKEFHIDAIYPEHLSRFRRSTTGKICADSIGSYRRATKKQKGNSNRYKTQPVTFHEIKEVDEENIAELEEISRKGLILKDSSSSSRSETDLKTKFELFYRSIKTDIEPVGMIKSESNDISELEALSNSSSENIENRISSTSTGFNPKSRPSI